MYIVNVGPVLLMFQSEIDQNITPSRIPLSNIPLPDFSTYVKTALLNGNSKTIWPKMIEEMAHFYYDVVVGDEVRNQTAYLTIGRQMVQTYPSVKRDGTKPWVGFATSIVSCTFFINWLFALLTCVCHVMFLHSVSMTFIGRWCVSIMC
jgi:hypothetical protein